MYLISQFFRLMLKEAGYKEGNISKLALFGISENPVSYKKVAQWLSTR